MPYFDLLIVRINNIDNLGLMRAANYSSMNIFKKSHSFTYERYLENIENQRNTMKKQRKCRNY